MKRQSMAASQNQASSSVINKVRKTPSEFQLTSFLVVQNNLTQAIGQASNPDSQVPTKSRQSSSKH